jgi:hypothetical protein
VFARFFDSASSSDENTESGRSTAWIARLVVAGIIVLVAIAEFCVWRRTRGQRMGGENIACVDLQYQ